MSTFKRILSIGNVNSNIRLDRLHLLSLFGDRKSSWYVVQ